jgi:hypothetical protein
VSSLHLEEAERATDREKKGLLEIRKKRRWVWAFFFSFIPLVYVFSILARSEKATSIFAITWMAVFFTAALRVMFSRCPRCEEFFHTWFFFIGSVSNPWARRCVHCGLRLVQDE